MTIKFIQIDDEGSLGFPGTRDEIVITTHAVHIDEILEVFQRFLKSMGFEFQGNLDFVNDFDDVPSSDDDPFLFPTERP